MAIYRGAIADAIPAELAFEAARAARDTLGGAVQVAATLPGRLGGPLLDVARDAFTQGLHIAAAISAIGALGLAVVVITLLRNVELAHEDEDETEGVVHSS